MKLQEAFVVPEPKDRLWELFEQVDRVARCVPGVEDVEVVDADSSRVRVTQAVGPMTATFELRMRITGRDPGRSIEFTAVGQSVKGAAGNVRAVNAVRLEPVDEGTTRVVVDADIALAGMIGSIGQKVVAKQAGKVTKAFAEALEREIRGVPAAVAVSNGAPAATSDARRPEPTPTPAPQPLPPPSLLRSTVPVPLPILVALVFAAGYLAGRIGRRP